MGNSSSCCCKLPQDVYNNVCGKCLLPVVTESQLEEAVAIMGNRRPINPVGMCFESSAYQIAFAGDTPDSAVLIHGLGTANMPGQEGRVIAHAWIEFIYKGVRMALDTTWGVVNPAIFYRENLKLTYSVEYTKQQVLDLWQKTDYPGPWDKKIEDVAKGVI